MRFRVECLRVPIAWLLSAACIAAGCGRASDTPSAPPLPAVVTFNKDIAPVFYANCVSCHRPGESVPFALLTYADAVKHADAIAGETLQHHMPPWLPEDGPHPFVGVRRLRADQIELIQRWVKGGKIEGSPADLPAQPVFPDGWMLGKPDQVVTTPRAYTVPAGTEDIYRDLVFRTTLTSDVYVRAVEFRTNGAPIHHAVIRVDTTTASRRRDGQDGHPGFPGMSSETVQDPVGQFVGWAPGRGPILSPDRMPWRLERGADLVIELHLAPQKTPAVIQPIVGLYFSQAPPEQVPVSGKLSSKTIDIPAGEANYVVTDSFELPVDVDLLSVYPHAHYLGKEMRVTAALPGGEVTPLLHIRQWSFHWQQDYRYVSPVSLPRGTKVTMRYTYDNSGDNEENPHHPPVRVKIGPRSVDEMGELTLQVLPRSPADAAQLAKAFEEHDQQATLAMAEMRVRDEPDVAKYHAFLGALYLDAGRTADAMQHLEAAIRLDERSAEAHSDLGTALMETGRLPEALVHLQRAAALAPRDETMPFNLGNALAKAGRFPEAEAALARAIAINPDLPDAHTNLGGLLLQRGQKAEALAHFERAAALVPDSAFTHNNLASALAASGRLTEAMQEVRRALALSPGYGPALDNQRRLQQMGIR